MPALVKGVINLRGKVIPVLDLRRRFGMELFGTRMHHRGGDRVAGNVMIGVVVDAVSEVLRIKADAIEQTPAFGTKLNTDFILGMAKVGKSAKILLGIDRELGTEAMAQLEKTAEK